MIISQITACAASLMTSSPQLKPDIHTQLRWLIQTAQHSTVQHSTKRQHSSGIKACCVTSLVSGMVCEHDLVNPSRSRTMRAAVAMSSLA